MNKYNEDKEKKMKEPEHRRNIMIDERGNDNITKERVIQIINILKSKEVTETNTYKK